MRVGLNVEAPCFVVAKSARRPDPALRNRIAAAANRRWPTRAVRTALALLTFAGIATQGHAQQPDAPVNIPLFLSTNEDSGQVKLGINVGIHGGDPKPYVFDTGSPVFNALYNPLWWPGFAPDPATNNAPPSTVMSPDEGRLMNNAQFCLGGSNKKPGPDFYCRGYTGNLVEVPSLEFYKKASDPAPAATLNADPGYVVNAAWNYGPGKDDNPNQITGPFNDPVVDDFFFGTFGAGNFVRNVPLVESPEDGNRVNSNYYAGGVLGQTMVSGLTQGYVVAANGQQNPYSTVNGPQGVDGANVTIGGQTMQPVTDCNPCVTVGLSPERLGQFWAAPPTDRGSAGVIPWAKTAPQEFQNPYGGEGGNNSSEEFGTLFKTTLTPPGAGAPAITQYALSMLDTGTPTLVLETTAPPQDIGQVANGKNEVNAGVDFTIAGVAPNQDAILGLTTTAMTLTRNKKPFANQPRDANSVTYNGTLTPPAKPTDPAQNTVGLPFFLQNSVMHDLDNRVIGYTPFFVTDAPLITTAGGPLIVGGNNVPLGLAGIISGPGGVTLEDGGQVQLSATNSYTGPTQIFGGAELYVSGPGSIAASSGVHNDGVFDISRAWCPVGSQNLTGCPVSIQNLTGSGDTYLGGQNLVVTNAAGTYAGTISDGGSNPLTGGGLILDGGTLVLSGISTYYSGPTVIRDGALFVNGSIDQSDVTISDGATLGGTGSVGAVTAADGATIAPGNSIGTLTVNGAFDLNPGAIYEVEVDAAGQSDTVIVNGMVNLTGATLNVLAEDGNYQPLTAYTIIENDGNDPVTGEFAEVNTNLAFLEPMVDYDGGNGNDVVLSLVRNDIDLVDVAKTRNQRGVAGALDTYPLDDPLFLSVLVQSAAGARQAYDALSGEIHGTVAGALAHDSRYPREAVLGRLMQASHNDSLAANGPQVAALNAASLYDGKSLAPLPPERTPLAFWTTGFGAWGNFDSDGNAASASRNFGGFLSGMDASLGGSWRAGLATGASFSSVDVNARASGADVETYHLGGYLGGMVGAFSLRGGGLYAWSDVDTSRAVIFPGFFERQSASYHADTGQLFGEIAYPMQMGNIALEPFGGIAIVSIDTDTFTERGGPLASLRAMSVDQDVGYTTLGLRAATTMQWGATEVTPHISAAWQHAFDDVTPGASFAFATSGIGFAIAGAPLAEDSALIDAGLDFALGENGTAGVSYAGQFGDGVTDNAVEGRVTWLF